MRKKISIITLMLLFVFMPKITFANTTNTELEKASPIQFEKDEYIRITQPIKDKTSVFDKEINIMGEARYNTEIELHLFNKKEFEKIYPIKAYKVYELDKVGISQTFNELIELEEGDNRLRFAYSYKTASGDLVEGRLVLYVTRKTEEDKTTLKNLRIDNTEQFINGIRKTR